MSINLFFVLIVGFLMGMYVYFTPDNSLTQDMGEIPKIELSNFTLYEISHKGIDHILSGDEGKKFDEYYVITSAKFSDNTKNLFQSIRSDDAEYRNDIIQLDGNVHYVREDGLEFRSHEGSYNTQKSLVQTQGSFVITQNANRVEGTRLLYNTELDTVSANQVRGSYQLK
ncbi:MAG: LPS export ABC transporter periplasmic protein LptC [Sulfuricurvum sp.]|jgi:LPS export ABC transporter protein LptC|uniref:LPS export ABC transporter periplasmic protein LptC n=1 Tax=Sulfuricurvum sp. TaxID=2025608 RepID=UPI00273496E4|nr:LPS export ABC transporter periplasmic protein LptC [Sulfuricurvum sp.]MDP2850699.1 LPS export ABC transporter periplasmic protein LptC [Sulfuricurvum sp.]MDP3291806.1 LPS export ABC transporter periplasmic protein LptC [Sulfuricurvum sp.]